MKTLKISKQISLPIDVVTQTMAMIGRKGSGKTYLATMIAEQMLDNKAQIIVIDPVGVWWGLRVDADGKRKGKEIFVIGGDHGDIPLVPEAGRKVAKLLVEKKISVVLDVSGFRIGEHKRFAAEFAEEFFHLKKSHRSPVHIFVEEAQKLIPQRVGADEARMVGAFEQIVRLGRNYGIGCSLVTQRPQSVNKEVLSQVECLCVLQVTGIHERKALEEWVQEVGADRTLVGELPGLNRGEGYVWSPSWLRIFERVNFSKKQTFDASATPEVGKQTQSASISAVDVKELREQMAEVVEQAEKDNPVALRKKIKELEGMVGREPAKIVPVNIDKIIKEVSKKWEGILNSANAEIVRLSKIIQIVARTVGSETNIGTAPHTFKIDKEWLSGKGFNVKVDISMPKSRAVMRTEKQEIVIAEGEKLFGLCEKKIYSFLANNNSNSFTKVQIGAVTGYSPTSGGFNNAIARLNAAGIIQRNGDKISLISNASELYIEGEEFSAEPNFWRSKLGLCEFKVYEFLWSRQNEVVSKDEVGEATQYSPTSGGFNNAIARLNSIGLIRRVGGGLTVNEEILNI